MREKRILVGNVLAAGLAALSLSSASAPFRWPDDYRPPAAPRLKSKHKRPFKGSKAAKRNARRNS